MAEAAALNNVCVCLLLFPLPAGSSHSGRTASSDSSHSDVLLIILPDGSSGTSPGKKLASTASNKMVVSYPIPRGEGSGEDQREEVHGNEGADAR